MFSIESGARSFKTANSIPKGFICKHEIFTETKKTIRLYNKASEVPCIENIVDIILPPPFSDNIYFGIIFFSTVPPCTLETLLNEFQLLDVRKNIPPKILTDVTLTAQDESEDNESFEESDDDITYETSDGENEVHEISEDDESAEEDISEED